MAHNRTNSTTQESEPLLQNSETSTFISSPVEEDQHHSQDQDQGDEESNLEMATTTKKTPNQNQKRLLSDKLASSAIILGILLFLPLTQYIVWDAHYGGGKKLGWFAFHPTFMSIGITGVVLSILSLQPISPTIQSKQKSFNIHRFVLMLIAFPAFGIGIYSMYHFKNLNKAPHFKSWHGKLGLGVVIWMITQITIGGLAHRLSEMNPTFKKSYKYHRASGYFLLPLLLVVAHIGGSWTPWSIGHSTLPLRIAAFDVGLGLIAVGILARVRLSKMKFI